jgi:hypothetical protein
VQGLGVIAGLAFAIVLIVEVYLGVIKVAIGDGRLVLGLAIVIDAFSRALGTAAAERARRRGLAFACAIGGSPVVAWCTLVRTSSRVQVEPAPLAGLLALAAGALALLGLLIGS